MLLTVHAIWMYVCIRCTVLILVYEECTSSCCSEVRKQESIHVCTYSAGSFIVLTTTALYKARYCVLCTYNLEEAGHPGAIVPGNFSPE